MLFTEKISVLLVEDLLDDERLATRAIAQMELPIKLEVARDGQEALEVLFSDPAREFDLVLLDLKLPKVSGSDVLRRIRNSNLNPWLPVIMLTSSDEQRDLIECYQARCSAYVRKAVNYHDYMNCMRTTLDFWIHVNRTPTPGGNFEMAKRC